MGAISKNRMIDDFVTLFFPRYCRACYGPLRKGEVLICLKCFEDLPRTDYHLYDDNPVKMKLQNLNKLERAMSFLRFVKPGVAQKLLHQLKYKGAQKIGETLGLWYGEELKSIGLDREIDLIIPVPLHSAKLKIRGYNQSACFASGLSQSLKIPWNDKSVIRVVKSMTQTKKSKTERWTNVAGAFKTVDMETLNGTHVLVVDDVITTGATLEACALEIESRCKAVSIATIAAAE